MAGNLSVQLQQRQLGNWTLPANASTKTQYDPSWSKFLPCQPYADNSATTAQAFVTHERLPPTSPATRFHSQGVHFQIMVWMGMVNEMNPTEWGWKQEIVNSNYDPKQCCAWRTLDNYPLQLFGGMQILSMQLQSLWTPLYCCMWPLPNWKLW